MNADRGSGKASGKEAKPASSRTAHTWGSIYRNALKRGDDHGYAAYLADAWEKRQQKKNK